MSVLTQTLTLTGDNTGRWPARLTEMVNAMQQVAPDMAEGGGRRSMRGFSSDMTGEELAG